MSESNAPKGEKDNERPTETDPHGRDHGAGLHGAESPDEVRKSEHFANSRDEGVVNERNYLDQAGEALASTLGAVTGRGDDADRGSETGSRREARSRRERDRTERGGARPSTRRGTEAGTSGEAQGDHGSETAGTEERE